MALESEHALLNEINRSVGTLTERVDGLRADVAESRQESEDNRNKVYLRLEQAERRVAEASDSISERVAELERLTADTASKVLKMEPVILAFTRMQQRGIGAMAVIGLTATVIGGAVALKWDAFVAWLDRLTSS